MQESDKSSLITEYKQKLYLDNLYKENTIDFDNYFKYSGKIEKGKRFKFNDMPIHNEIFDSFRVEQKKIQEAINLLEKNGFIVYNKEKKYATDRQVYSNKKS